MKGNLLHKTPEHLNNRSATHDLDPREARALTRKQNWYKYGRQAEPVETDQCPHAPKRKKTNYQKPYRAP